MTFNINGSTGPRLNYTMTIPQNTPPTQPSITFTRVPTSTTPTRVPTLTTPTRVSTPTINPGHQVAQPQTAPIFHGEVHTVLNPAGTHIHGTWSQQAFQDLQGLQTAMQQGGFSNFPDLPIERTNPSAVRIWTHEEVEAAEHSSENYQRLYDVYRNVRQPDARNRLTALPQEIQNQVYGQIYALAGSPQTDDCWWGGNHAFDDLQRLQRAIQQVAYNSFRNLPTEQRNPVAERIWIYGGRQQGDANWGENHANDNADILFRSLIRGLRASCNLSDTMQSDPSCIIS